MTTHIQIQQEDFSIEAEVKSLRDHDNSIGAVATFTGIVRGDDDLAALTLEHYPGMTEREIARHIEKARARWPLAGVTIIHRVGRLMPGDNIVLVAVAAAHRKAGFEACEFLMDYLKTQAPFWKREERGGREEWVEAKASDDEAAKRWR
jgi:molybdopterin synthase catalytic subunit